MNLLEVAYIVTSFIICQIILHYSDSLCRLFKVYEHRFYKGQPHMNAKTEAERIEFASRVVSTIHALFQVPIMTYTLLTDPATWEDPQAYHPISEMCMAVSAGYFISDLILIVRYKMEPMVPLIFHHLLTLSSGAIAITANQGGWYAAALFLNEATNPIYNLQWQMEILGLHVVYPRVYRVVELSLAFVWITCRFILCPLVLVQLYLHLDAVLEMRYYLGHMTIITTMFLTLFNSVHMFDGPFGEILFRGGFAGRSKAPAPVSTSIDNSNKKNGKSS